GNTFTKADSTGATTYTWDFENRLTSVHLPNQTTVTFKYGPFGRRIQKGGSVYVYDGANLIEEADGAGNLAARNVFSSGVDEPFATYRAGTWEFYLPDGLGSIASLRRQSQRRVPARIYPKTMFKSSSTRVTDFIGATKAIRKKWQGSAENPEG